tara:strand:- start:25 stop:543 length:519 start_codon:yes stop_codon:yes gene_type:complete
MSYIIYKICCDDLPEFIYIGSTKSFRHRKNQHKSCVNKGDTKKLYTTIRENGGWDNWRMVIVEDIGEVSLTQARIKEEEHRVNLNANMNERKCKGDKKEYDKEYKKTNEKYKENQKEYKLEYNKLEYVKERKKESDKKYGNKIITCECGRTILLGHKKRHEQSLIHKKYTEN